MASDKNPNWHPTKRALQEQNKRGESKEVPVRAGEQEKEDVGDLTTHLDINQRKEPGKKK